MKNFKRLVIILFLLLGCINSLIYIDSICATDVFTDVGGGRNTFTEREAIELVFTNISSNFPIMEEQEVIEPVPIKEPEIEVIEFEEKSYTEEEYELLAHLIFAESGSDWCSDKMQQYTGSVVLNRMASKYYPNTMYEVIYQKGQYSVTRSGAINKTPNQRAYDCARFLLENSSVLPSNVIFQSQHIQGDGIYEKVQNMYFCYKN